MPKYIYIFTPHVIITASMAAIKCQIVIAHTHTKREEEGEGEKQSAYNMYAQAS